MDELHQHSRRTLWQPEFEDCVRGPSNREAKVHHHVVRSRHGEHEFVFGLNAE